MLNVGDIVKVGEYKGHNSFILETGNIPSFWCRVGSGGSLMRRRNKGVRVLGMHVCCE